jgi:hypothetical protein
MQAIATFDADISPSFPYVHTELGGWDYDQQNQVVLLKLSPPATAGIYKTKLIKPLKIQAIRTISSLFT